MAVYKIPQDVEAEDKLLGPFTFRQFIFLIIATISGWMTWVLFQLAPFMGLLTLPIFLVFAFLGLYRRADQPVEVFILASLTFLFKPRRRVWQRDHSSEGVRFVAKALPPRAVPKNPKEVKGQLHRLAQIIDTRGWSIKNPVIQEPTQSHTITSEGRIVLPDITTVEPLDLHPADDVLDIENNPVAQDLSRMAEGARSQAKDAALAKMQVLLNQTAANEVVATPSAAVGEEATSGMTHPVTTGILQLAQNDQQTVSQIAAQAGRYQNQMTMGEEVNIRNGAESNTPPTVPAAGA